MSVTVNWASLETWEGLVAGIYATGVKIDLTAVAAYTGTTYNALENRLRKTKKLAETLKANAKVDANGKLVVTASPANRAQKTAGKAKTPTKDGLKVANARVTKKSTPKKTSVKREETDDENPGNDHEVPAFEDDDEDIFG